MILKIAAFAGKLSGLLFGLFDFRGKSWYLRYLFRRSFVTAWYRRHFRKFGEKSLLSPGIMLIRPDCISVGANSSILRNSILEVCRPEGCIEIGNEVSIGEYAHITAATKIVVGNGVLTGRFVLITDNSHGAGDSRKELEISPLTRDVVSKGEVVIGNNVWIGDKVSILPGVHIGDGCVIGANSVVTKDIPAYAIAVGNPCRVVKQR